MMEKITNLCLFSLILVIPFSFAGNPDVEKQSKAADAYRFMLRTLYKNDEEIKDRIDAVAIEEEKDSLLLNAGTNGKTHKKSALDLFKKISAFSLKQLIETIELEPLTEKEQALKEKMAALKFSFKHESESPSLQNNTLYSYYQAAQLDLLDTKNPNGVMLYAGKFGRCDFVIFSLVPDQSGEPYPHHSHGSTYYLFDGEGEEFTDFGFGTYYRKGFGWHEYPLILSFSLVGDNKLSPEAATFFIINRDKLFNHMHKNEMFAYEDMLKSLPYMMIGYLRELKCIASQQDGREHLYKNKTSDECANEIINYICNPATTGAKLHEVVNAFFSIDFNVPHSVPIDKHCKTHVSDLVNDFDKT